MPLCRYLLLILALLSHTQASSSSSPTGMSPIAAYYRPHDLFDQTAVLQEIEHRDYLTEMGLKKHQLPLKNLGCCDSPQKYDLIEMDDKSAPLETTQKCFEEAVEQEYWKNRRWLYLRAIAQEFSSIVFLAAPLVIGYYIALGADSPTSATMLITTAFLATVYSTNTLRALIAAALFPANDPFVPYECAYARRKAALGYLDWDVDREHEKKGFLNNSAEEVFLTARLGMLNPRASFDYLETLLKIPTESTPIKVNIKLLFQTLHIYSNEAIHKIALCCINHENSYKKQWGVNQQQREFLTLISPPGQGKSYCVDQIANCLGIPVVRIDLSGMTPEGLLGTQTEPGLLLCAIAQLTCRNGILFIDELCLVAKNESLLATLLTTLDPTRKTFYSHYLQRTIDLSHLFVIGAGNDEFKAVALKSRFNKEKTVDLTIQNRNQFFDILLGSYLLTKMGEPVSEVLLKKWRQQLFDYFPKGGGLSFRDGQNFIDCLVGNKRLEPYIL